MATFKSKRNPGKTIKAGEKATKRLKRLGYEEASTSKTPKSDESKS